MIICLWVCLLTAGKGTRDQVLWDQCKVQHQCGGGESWRSRRNVRPHLTPGSSYQSCVNLHFFRLLCSCPPLCSHFKLWRRRSYRNPVRSRYVIKMNFTKTVLKQKIGHVCFCIFSKLLFFFVLIVLAVQSPTGKEVKITSSTEKKPSKCVLL